MRWPEERLHEDPLPRVLMPIHAGEAVSSSTLSADGKRAVVGFDDGLAIIIFGFAAAAAKVLLNRESGGDVNIWESILEPFREIGLSLIIGTVIGVLFGFAMKRFQKG